MNNTDTYEYITWTFYDAYNFFFLNEVYNTVFSPDYTIEGFEHFFREIVHLKSP